MDSYGIVISFEIYHGIHTSAVANLMQNHVMPFFSQNPCSTKEYKQAALVGGELSGAPSPAEGHLELGAGDDAAGDQGGGGALVVQLDGLVGEDFEVGSESLFIAQRG